MTAIHSSCTKDMISDSPALLLQAGRWQHPSRFGAGLRAGIAALHNGSNVGSNFADEGT